MRTRLRARKRCAFCGISGTMRRPRVDGGVPAPARAGRNRCFHRRRAPGPCCRRIAVVDEAMGAVRSRASPMLAEAEVVGRREAKRRHGWPWASPDRRDARRASPAPAAARARQRGESDSCRGRKAAREQEQRARRRCCGPGFIVYDSRAGRTSAGVTSKSSEASMLRAPESLDALHDARLAGADLADPHLLARRCARLRAPRQRGGRRSSPHAAGARRGGARAAPSGCRPGRRAARPHRARRVVRAGSRRAARRDERARSRARARPTKPRRLQNHRAHVSDSTTSGPAEARMSTPTLTPMPALGTRGRHRRAIRN